MEYLLEQSACPICLEIPLGAIYQCREGHTICSSCYSNVTSCPQCRIPFDGPEGIRNRMMETLLDSVKLDCQFSGNGCSVKLKRQELKGHMNGCSFRPTELCKLLGFACDFGGIVSSDKDRLLSHLQSVHGCVTWTTGDDLSVAREVTLLDFMLVDVNDVSSLWTPIHIRLLSPAQDYLLLGRVSKRDGCLFWCFLRLGEAPGPNVSVEFTIKNLTDEAEPLSWTQASTSLSKGALFLSSAPLRLPLDLLLKHYAKEDLTMSLRLQNGSGSIASSGSGLPLTLMNFPVTKVKKQEDILDGRAICNGCRDSLTSVRYKCLQCSDDDRCEVCMESRAYPSHIYAVIKSQTHEDTIRRAGGYRDGQWRTIMSGSNSKLTDLLETNASTYLLAEGDEVAFSGVECDACGASPIMGKLFSCLQCVDYDLCFECFDGGAHAHHVFGVVTNLFQNLVRVNANAARDREPLIQLE